MAANGRWEKRSLKLTLDLHAYILLRLSPRVKRGDTEFDLRDNGVS